MKINYDLKGERSILGTCVLFKDRFYEAAQKIEPCHFYDIDNQNIFRAMLEVHNAGGDVTLSAIESSLYVNNLQKTTPVLGELKAYADKHAFSSHVQNLLENYTKTRLAYLFQQLNQEYDAYTIEQISDLFADALNQNTQTPIYKSPTISQNFFEMEFKDWLQKQQENFEKGIKISGLSTGLPGLDIAINGLNDTHYICVAGDPGSGKTTFALQIMDSVMKQGHKVGFVSLEMTKEQAYIKLLSMETNINFRKIMQGDVNGYQYHTLLEADERMKKNDKLLLIDGNISSLQALQVRLKQLVEIEGARLVVIDYITLINHTKNGANQAQVISDISSTIRACLKELKVPGIVISQLNRLNAQLEKPPEKYNLLGTGKIEQDSHEILMLHNNKEMECRDLYVRKSRFGQETTLRYMFNGSKFFAEEFLDDYNKKTAAMVQDVNNEFFAE